MSPGCCTRSGERATSSAPSRPLRGALGRLSIRWKLALTSAALTFAILCVFALVVGELTQRRIRSDFSNQLIAAADYLRDRVDVKISSEGMLQRFSPNLDEYSGPERAVIRVVTADGLVVQATRRAPDLGAPFERSNERKGYRIETRPIPLTSGGAIYVQYARRVSDMEATIRRVRFFLLFGVMAGTALALLGGLMLAQRAMAPIAALTVAAEKIRRTRDPGLRLPEPESDDEVARLARTLDGMLRALDEAQEETAATLQRQREFVADASHELRTPLTSVLANLELLAETLDGDRGEAAASALRSSRRMRRLVADLLLLARADAGRRAAPFEPQELGQVVVEAAAELEPVVGDRNLSVDCVEGAVIDGVRDDLHRLALNLMENAVRHTPAGTTVKASVSVEDGAAVLRVDDDGPGIAPELRERVFERFVRVGGESSGSSGLGLSIVRAVAESHGGTVSVEDDPDGVGARFVVSLPVAQARTDAGAQPLSLA